jgi:outer membrane protein OmpA-like peptidoglycan-associated protein
MVKRLSSSNIFHRSGGNMLHSAALLAALMLVSCSAPEKQLESPAAGTVVAQPAPASVNVPPTPPVAFPHDEAVLMAARDLFNKAQIVSDTPISVVIDPLVDGTTGMQSVATQSIGNRLLSVVKSEFPKFQIKPLNAANVAALPLVFIGTFTPINLQGKGEGERDAYRVCFALADLKTGKIVSKGFARSQTAGVDPTPLPYFSDAPMWMNDKVVEGYIKTCQGTKAGDPINPDYLDKVLSVVGIAEATSAYNNKQYKESLARFSTLLRSKTGDQARVHTGIYLSNLKLGRREPAMKTFAQIAQRGLNAQRLAVKFNFQPGSVILAKNENPYDRWIKELAIQSDLTAKAKGTCFELSGHTGRGGLEPMNEKISLQRAEYVKQRLMAERKDLATHINTRGYGSRQALVATGREDASDALDRRIEFKPGPC